MGRFRQLLGRRRSVSTISSEKSRSVKMRLQPGSLSLSASSTDASSADEALEVSYGGPEMEIGFNARYLLDIASQVDRRHRVRAGRPGRASLVRTPVTRPRCSC